MRTVTRERYGPWAVVTGASSGIGREFAVRLAAAGVDVALVARRADALDTVASELAGRHGVRTLTVPADLTTDAGIAAVQAATADLDVGLLVAAAGYGTGGPFLDADLSAERAMLAVNCGAVLALTQHYARRMAERGRGGIVLLASLVGRQGTPLAANYAATKAYVQVLGEGLARELAERGVDVVVSAPGPVHSGFADRAGMTMRFAARPARVAASTLDALGRRTVVVPGLLSTVLTWSLAPLPRPLRTTIMASVMRSMLAGPAPGSERRTNR